MEKSEIKILDTHYYEGKISAVYAELPNGQRSWLAIPLQFSFEEPFYLEGLPLYSDLEIYDEDREEYFYPQEGYFGKICGKVVAITDSSNSFYNVEVECDGLVFRIEFNKRVKTNLGCYVESSIELSLCNYE